MALPNQQSVIYRVTHDSELAYVEPALTQAAITLKTVVQIPANTLNQSINLATLFPALTSAVAITVQDISASPGLPFNIAASNTDPGITVRATSLISWGASGLQTLFADNPSLTLPLDLLILVTGS